MGRSQLKPTFEEECFPSQVEIRAVTIDPPAPEEGPVVEQNWPLSFGQQRLWFLEQLHPNTALYNMPCVARLLGKFDQAAFQAALNDLASRHAMLRTHFVCEKGPRQVVEAEMAIPLAVLDLRHVPAIERAAAAQKAAHAEINRPFDLTAAPLVRTLVIRCDEQEQVLAFTMHHIISDEWSLKIIFKELGDLYQFHAHGKPANLPELPLQYPDFALRQQDCLRDEALASQLEYWRNLLGDRPPLTELTPTRPRKASPGFRGKLKSKHLPPGLSEELKALARKERATFFIVLLAAFKALVHRYTGLKTLIVASPIAGRNSVETEGLVGFFVNTLLLRTEVRGDPTFREFLKGVRERMLGAYANQELPLEKLVEELQPERSLHHLPFTRVMFMTQHDFPEKLEWGDVQLEFLEAATDTAKFELTFSVQEMSGGWLTRAEYNTDLFDERTIDRMFSHFENVLKGIVRNPECRLSDLPLLSDEESRTLLQEWNNTSTDYPREKCIHEIFEEQAARSPAAVALAFGQQTISYGELNERANQIAHHLKRNGVEPGAPVGLCLQRSAEWVLGMLGILKAGGAYVPLDADYPAARLSLMLSETNPPVVLAQRQILGRLPDSNAKIICLDSDWETIAREADDNLPALARPMGVAYVMFTSGSTGKPKGVMVPHRAVSRLVLNTNYMQLGTRDRIAQVSNVSFDAATFEVWGALLNGGCLVGISTDIALAPKDFARELREQQITAMFLTAALFNLVAKEVPDAFATVRTVIVGGEALDPKWVRAVLESGPPERLLNGYGPTENTTFTCWHDIRNVAPDATNIPIGKPISNTQVYILDNTMKPVPAGVPGELYAAGEGLALGYWNQPELTAQRFVRHSFSKSSEPEYLYKTGDLARYLSSGEIEFLGRLDEQVKVRGFRVEPAEIEIALKQHIKIADCVVGVCGAQAEDKRLVAYLVPSNGEIPTASDLRKFLSKDLPHYMIPSAFVEVNHLALTPNGKLDRRCLPNAETASPRCTLEPVAPRDEVECRLVEIWQAVLGLTKVGVQDKFFDLGGHSLLAVQVISRIEKAFSKKLRVATIFQAQTIEELASILRQEIEETSVTASTSVVPIQTEGSRPPLFLVHGAGGGMFWGYVNLSKHLGPTQPIYAFRSRGLEGREEFPTIEAIAASYVDDLRRVQPRGPYHLGGYCFGGNVAYEMARQLKAQGESVALLALLNCSPPNSRYTQIRVTPAWTSRFLKNLGYWFEYFNQWSPNQRKEFFKWKYRRFKNRLDKLCGGTPSEMGTVDVGDLVDLSAFSLEERKVWESHIRSLIQYKPSPYEGVVHLIRSPGHPLWCSYDEDYGWGALAKGGVITTTVSGAHEKILEEPCVETVARRVGELLQKLTNTEKSTKIQSEEASRNVGPDRPETFSGSPVVDRSGGRIDLIQDPSYSQRNHRDHSNEFVREIPLERPRQENAAFWKAQLDGAPALLELPTDFPRPARQSRRLKEVKRTLPGDLAHDLRISAARLKSRDSSMLLAAVFLLLRRCSRQEDIVVGLLVDGPKAANGHINGDSSPWSILPLRTQVADDLSFDKLLAQIEAVRGTSLLYKDFSFAHLLEWIQLPRDPSYHPVCQVAFRHDEGEFDGQRGAPEDLAQFDLTFQFSNSATALGLRISYAEDLFEAATIERMIGHWQTLLSSVIRASQQPLPSFTMLTEPEEKTLVVDWNNTQRPYGKDKTLAQLFLEQCERTPDAEALIVAGTRLTYRELAARATAIARRLRALGVEQEMLVGICVHRSWEMIASILGTLLAGAAYVPMDPAYPKDRLLLMIEDAKVRVLITEKDLLPGLPETRSTMLCLEDIEWNQEDNPSVLTPVGSPESLAYVIYTSGSTGKPKGVALEHRNAVAFVNWAKDAFAAEELNGVLASTSICFDLSIFEMFVPLCLGGKMVLVENALALATAPAAAEVRMINTVPSAIRELLRLNAVPSSVQVVNLAGEPLPTSLVNEIYAQTSARKVYDLYGPTETTTYSTYILRQAGARASIGRPLANEQVYLLDAMMKPAPIGVPADLYIGGDGVARGYLGQPGLTAERFINNPFRPGERLYKTGDLARWRNDGNLEFLGRVDHQVKIRGFRIELGEIEALLKKQNGVVEAVVLAREDQPGDKRLVAYVGTGATLNGNPPAAENLVAALRERLPAYMTPSAFVFLQALPQTPNGKIDRKRLPAPEYDRPASGKPVAGPRNPAEKQVLAIWQEVLRTKQISVEDNFFDLGGNSLLAIQVISRLRDQFKIQISLTLLFDAPTIEALAEGLMSGRWQEKPPELPALVRLPRSGPLPVSFVQERLWFLDQLQPGGDAHHVPAAFRFRGPLDGAVLQRALDRIVRRHEALRTSLAYRDGMLTQVIAPELTVRIEAIAPSPNQTESVETWAMTQANEFVRRPFDVSQPPLIRARLLTLGHHDHVFVVVMHHTISDGWSLDIFFTELRAHYQAISKGELSADLPELPVQYADFANWKHQCLQSAELQKDIAYWKRTLAGAPAVLELPADFSSEAAGDLKVDVATLDFTSAALKSFHQISHREGSTLFMALLSGLAITLRKWTGQEDMVIGTVVAGRNSRDVENVIGCFINFLPLRIRCRESASGHEVLRQVRGIVTEAQDHQDCPFERIVGEINPERKLNQNPLYNVALLLQDHRENYFESDGAQSEAFPVSLQGAMLDLRFEAVQTQQGLRFRCEYRRDLFAASSISSLLAAFQTTMETLGTAPETLIKNFAPVLRPEAEKSDSRAALQHFAVTSTFTAEPLGEPLKQWMKELRVRSRIEFAPYNQVFQQLLDPSSLLSRNQQGLNVILLRLEDWERVPDQERERGRTQTEALERNAREFVTSLKSVTRRTAVPCLVCLCPSAESNSRSDTIRARERVEKRLINELKVLNGVYTLTAGEVFHWYPVKDFYDASTDELGHVPYTPVFFTALSTAIVRKFHALNRPPVKVIALDCDNTLWTGVCGEDGAEGIRLEGGRIALQEFMRRQADAGVLLCSCSKNNEDDVRQVFRRRGEMPLRASDFTAWKLNWQPKSENLKALARELKLGLDSFVFVDDNPVECAEVEASCPGVQCLLLPEDPQQIPDFLNHCWIFDHLKLTAEDRTRGEKYRQNLQREQLREQSTSLADFLAGLEIQSTIELLQPEQLPRASQLTQRTNQFNCTTRRRSETELRTLLSRAEVLAISVRDRFGDYGFAGLIICEVHQSSLQVDSFLLSCRVLGRGIEHGMLARLGEMAQEKGLGWVDVQFIPSPKNRPAHDFLESVGAPFRQARNGGLLFRFPARVAAQIQFDPQSNNSELAAVPLAKTPAEGSGDSVSEEPVLGRSRRYREFALEFNCAERIYERFESKSVLKPGARAGYAVPSNDLERQLCELWQKLLRVSQVGVKDNFFELGGHSLLAVRLFSEVEKLTGHKLPLVTIFQSPTVRQLGRVLSRSETSASSSLLVPLQPKGSRPSLFLVHGAGGDVLWGYANLASHLSADQPVYGIKSRGQARREEFETLEAMAECYLKEVRAFQPVGPYYLGGYCFGGNVAYEMGRQLKAQGQEVALLLLLDSAPANAGYERVAWWRPSYSIKFARNLAYWLQDFAELPSKDRRRFVLRKGRSLVRKVVRRLTGHRAVAETVDLEEVIDPAHFPENELKLWKTHLHALEQHVQQPYSGRVVLMRTRGQPLISSLEEDFCWGKLVSGGVDVRRIPGSHEAIFMEPHVRSLADQLTRYLSPAGATNPIRTAP